LLAAFPGLFDPLFDLFNFRRGGGRRLLAVLLFGNVAMLLLILRNQSETDVVRRDFQLLMEWMGLHSLSREDLDGLPAGDRVVVVLPAHNEAANIGAVLGQLPAKVDGHPVVTLVVDDASEDATASVAKDAGALVARLPIRRGGGQAVRVGYQMALQLDAVVVASIDADGQHDPNELQLLVEPILRGEYDMVQGSRVLGRYERESAIRHLGVLVLSRLVSLMTGTRITDVSNGYRAIRTETLQKLILQQDQFWTSEVIIEALRNRARIKEVPITVRARASGETKKPRPFKYGWQFFKVIVKTWLR
ncbi:MAG: glycosyltransferase family 2 protein, partial [Actinomycetota bacterium]|nr:glycosyltransferase family 2 protein [Actinomycetota bacterium]